MKADETPPSGGGRALWLDGNPEEAIELGTGEPQALGRDPFADDEGPDPLLTRVDAPAAGPAPAEPRLVLVGARRSAEVAALPPPAATPSRREPGTARRRRRRAPPRLSEIEPPARLRLLERLLGDEDRRRLASLSHLVDDAPWDRYGLSPETVRAAAPFALALYRLWFRVRSRGHENLPSQGPVILAANHGGLLPFDGAMTVMDVMLHTDPPRLARSIVERWAGTLPWVNVLFARLGQVIGTRENFADLLRDGQPVLVFPEGIDGIRKTITQRYRLQSFRVGFIEQALRARAPIVPVAILGPDDQTPILHDFQGLARRLGLPALPVTPTFPWFGPLGLMPYPVRYRILYGEPLAFHDRFGPEGAEDARLVQYLANQVRRTVQTMLDRNR